VRHAVENDEEEEDGELEVIINDVLDTIDAVDSMWLRYYVKLFCKQDNGFAHWLATQMMVPGKDIVRYHIDTDDEDADETEDDEDDQEENVCVEDLKMTSKYQYCTRCKQSFDLATNYRGACSWHPGQSLTHYARLV
jgi:hypothetical protein